MEKCEWYENARKETIEKILKECEYPEACRKYFEGLKIDVTAEHVDHEFDCGTVDSRLKKINIEIDFQDNVLQEFDGALEDAKLKALATVFDAINSYVTICIENPE